MSVKEQAAKIKEELLARAVSEDVWAGLCAGLRGCVPVADTPHPLPFVTHTSHDVQEADGLSIPGNAQAKVAEMDTSLAGRGRRCMRVWAHS